MFIKRFNDVISNHALFSQLIRNTVVVFEFFFLVFLPMEVFCLQGLSPGCDFLVNMCMYNWLLYNFHLAFWFLNKSLNNKKSVTIMILYNICHLQFKNKVNTNTKKNNFKHFYTITVDCLQKLILC